MHVLCLDGSYNLVFIIIGLLYLKESFYTFYREHVNAIVEIDHYTYLCGCFIQWAVTPPLPQIYGSVFACAMVLHICCWIMHMHVQGGCHFIHFLHTD